VKGFKHAKQRFKNHAIKFAIIPFWELLILHLRHDECTRTKGTTNECALTYVCSYFGAKCAKKGVFLPISRCHARNSQSGRTSAKKKLLLNEGKKVIVKDYPLLNAKGAS